MRTLKRLLVGATGWALLTAASPVTAGPLDGPGAQKALVCSACHGFAGNSRGDTVPILAGADAAYLKKALSDYAAGRRLSAEMEPYAKMAVHFGVDDIVQYFASQPRQATPVKADPAAIQRGRDSVRRLPRRRREGRPGEANPGPHGPARRIPPQPALAIQTGSAEPGRRRPEGGEAADPDASRGDARGPGGLLLEPPVEGAPARSARQGRPSERRYPRGE